MSAEVKALLFVVALLVIIAVTVLRGGGTSPSYYYGPRHVYIHDRSGGTAPNPGPQRRTYRKAP